MSDKHDPRAAPNPPSHSEPRAGDVISGRVSHDELDPETVAQLAAWFGAPAEAVEPPRESPEQAERRELWERRRRAMDAVEPGLLARLESRKEVGDEFIHLPEPLYLPIETPVHRFELSAWKVNDFEVREREIPEDISDALHERTPQAILRDLNRPVLKWSLFLQPQDAGVDVGGERARQRIDECVHTRYQVRMRERSRASRQAQEGIADLRARLAEPWEHVEIPEERRTQSSAMPTAEDLRWFGDVGYDPDL